jgi:hypothetical protein
LRCAGFGTKAFRPLRPATPDMNSPYWIEKSADIMKLAPRRSTTISRCRAVIGGTFFAHTLMVSDIVIE